MRKSARVQIVLVGIDNTGLQKFSLAVWSYTLLHGEVNLRL